MLFFPDLFSNHRIKGFVPQLLYTVYNVFLTACTTVRTLENKITTTTTVIISLTVTGEILMFPRSCHCKSRVMRGLWCQHIQSRLGPFN